MIETLKLSKHFGAIRAVDDLSFKVDRGEVLGFLGPNGAGKSTTMKMLTCFLTPTSGTARVNGHDILTDSMSVRRVLGYLPETAPAYGEMSVLSFLDFVAGVRGISGSSRRKAIDRVLDECALEGVRHQSVETLSKGYKRRVGLAQAIIHQPPVLIMDEPTDGLDPNQKHEVRGLIQRMAKDKVIILSTHILEEVDAVCTRAVVIARGRLVADGTPEALERRSRFHGSVTLSVHGVAADQLRSSLEKVEHVEKVETLGEEGKVVRLRVFPFAGKLVAPAVTELLRERKWSVDEFTVEKGRLDEVFRELTRQADEDARTARARARHEEDDEDEDDEDLEAEGEDLEDDEEFEDEDDAEEGDDEDAEAETKPAPVAESKSAKSEPAKVEAKPEPVKAEAVKAESAKPAEAAKPTPKPEPAKAAAPASAKPTPKGGGGGGSKPSGGGGRGRKH